MYTLRNYTNTKCELEMAKTRLNLLIDKKIAIYDKYFGITATYKDVSVDGGEDVDNMVEYMSEITTIDIGTGMSIVDEITHQQKRITKLQKYLEEMSEALGKMTGIEYQLFYEIIFKGTNISQAVEKIAEENGKDVSTVWKYNYKKIKKDVNKIKNFEYV